MQGVCKCSVLLLGIHGRIIVECGMELFKHVVSFPVFTSLLVTRPKRSYDDSLYVKWTVVYML